MMSEKEYREARFAEAKEIRLPKELAKFVEKVSAEPHDYGTIVMACAAAMKAAFNVVNASPSGGITGFQAGCLMWEMIEEFGMFGEDAQLRILDFADVMYPQYDHKFLNCVDPERAKLLADLAKRRLAESTVGIHPEVRARMEQVSRGEFPEFITAGEER